MSSSNGCVEVCAVQDDPPVQHNPEETNNNTEAKPAPSKRDKPTKANKRLTGTVKWFNVKDGFGFITRHDTGEDVFVHASNILRPNSRHNVRSVGEGEVVEFGLVASKVTGPGFKRVKGSAFVRPKSFGGRPKSGSGGRSKREEVVKKQEIAENQPVGDGPIVKEMAELKVEDKNEVNDTEEVPESVPVEEEVCVKEEVNNDDENDDDTVSNDSTSTVTTAESIE